MNKIFDILDDMDAYLQDCSTMPFSNKKVIVNMESMYEFMSDLRSKLPEEIKKSQRLLEDKERLFHDTNEKIKVAEEQAAERVRQLVDDHEIKRQAIEEAGALMEKTRQESDEIKEQAYAYVASLLQKAQEVLQETLGETNKRYQQYENHMIKQLEMLDQNRQDLG